MSNMAWPWWASIIALTTIQCSQHQCHAFQIGPLLSTCIDACQRGCDEIRRVQECRENSSSNSSNNEDTLRVSLKIASDPKSALTEADTAAQHAITDSLRLAWGESLHIVGEEDDEDDDAPSSSRDVNTVPLRTDLLKDDIDGETDELDPNDVTIFVDPLDGTAEFVAGRLENCQVLVGIAIGGEAVAGAVGIPFPTGAMGDEATVLYGLDGLGTGTIGAPLTRGPWALEKYIDQVKYPIPHYATGGDNDMKVIEAATDNLKKNFGGSSVRYGGAGNRVLAAALGEVACSLGHKVGGPWDLCAPEALAKAMGARMTDLFGDPIDMYYKNSRKDNNKRGFLITPPGSSHKAVKVAVKQALVVQEYKKSLL